MHASQDFIASGIFKNLYVKKIYIYKILKEKKKTMIIIFFINTKNVLSFQYVGINEPIMMEIL